MACAVYLLTFAVIQRHEDCTSLISGVTISDFSDFQHKLHKNQNTAHSIISAVTPSPPADLPHFRLRIAISTSIILKTSSASSRLSVSPILETHQIHISPCKIPPITARFTFTHLLSPFHRLPLIYRSHYTLYIFLLKSFNFIYKSEII